MPLNLVAWSALNYLGSTDNEVLKVEYNMFGTPRSKASNSACRVELDIITVCRKPPKTTPTSTPPKPIGT
ncbi:hypothetical protein RchiOBHm_Chr5g0016591 [Rosa chinensis]|uniref:Uncharacterized protein n=1 Tax=Rosa chinensis TaxID=74649 RepID=A0A2P6Q692_ROSCH|nr:hypothetical protein RchiOBHm_Chr5g0016591 [Rosa chinensis]